MATPAKKKAATSPSRIKNYRSQSSMANIFEEIRVALATHKARRVTFDYDDEGQATAISFLLYIHNKAYAFRLPARFENVKRLVAESYASIGGKLTGDRLDEQAYRTAWANIRDWVLAQMAIIDSGMVKVEEVFMPYLIVEGETTMFEAFEQQRALPQPRGIRIEEVK